MQFRLLILALLLLPAPALAGVKETVAALAPSGIVLVVDSKGDELVAQNADKPFTPASVTKIVTAWLALEAWAATTASKHASISTPNGCCMSRAAAILT